MQVDQKRVLVGAGHLSVEKPILTCSGSPVLQPSLAEVT
jgi:hypothetical protein